MGKVNSLLSGVGVPTYSTASEQPATNITRSLDQIFERNILQIFAGGIRNIFHQNAIPTF